MNKQDFEKIIREPLKDLPLDKQIKLLDSMEKWLREINTGLKCKLNKQCFYCEKCKKYYLTKKAKTQYEEELVKGKLVYDDGGYHDFDKIADVTYRVSYYVCPECGIRKEKARYVISEENRRNKSPKW